MKIYLKDNEKKKALQIVLEKNNISSIDKNEYIEIEKREDISFLSEKMGEDIEKIEYKNPMVKEEFIESLIKKKEPIFICGPCSVESKEDILLLAKDIKEAGANILRGGTFKVRSSPYSFQGLGYEGVDYLYQGGKETNLPIITEMTEINQEDVFSKAVDIIQIGARNMQNFPLLKEAARIGKPLLIKRGMQATIKEYLKAIEYVFMTGNDKIILCERGIRTFENSTRFTIDMAAIPILQKETHLPVILDPSHGTGRRELVYSMSLAGIAAGADGLILEVHNDPENAKSDGRQSILPSECKKIIDKSKEIYNIL